MAVDVETLRCRRKTCCGILSCTRAGGGSGAIATFFFFFFVFLVVLSVPSRPKLAEARVQATVVNGREVTDYRYYGFQVVLFYEGTLKCGASIIAPSYVLTAAHCVDQGSISTPTFSFIPSSVPSPLPPRSRENPRHHRNLTTDPDADADYYDIGYGSADKDESKRVRASEVWIHKGYIRNETYQRVRVSNNYAILKLVKPLPFSDNVRSISLSPDDSLLEIGDDLTVSGWGSVLTGGPYPNKLKSVTVDHLPNICAIKYSNRGYYGTYQKVWFDKAEMICAGCQAGGTGGCTKDSGGPLTAKSSRGGCPVQVGLGNWERLGLGLGLGSGCAEENNPDVYARVSNAVSWIESVVRQPVRSTVVVSATDQCDNCIGNQHPTVADCQRADKYDLQLCDMQARLASAFVLEEPRCNGGKHKLKAYLNFHRGFPAAPAAKREQLKQGYVFFLRTDKGSGRSIVMLPRHGNTTTFKGVRINTPLKKPQFAGNPPTAVRFDTKEGAWIYRWPGCSSQHTYAALYVLDMGSGKPKYYQISIAVGKVPLP
ncbi:hypothetical protein CBR_g33912 [Chara braunii]|uniref:Peptidase S1 domain-containing protein n=1 Tax=Chara braunii TaxID=69332 RepID=A0A388LHM6_CHABU|nr:hypothetical protein CBR_g33912 [Chara braunii]|eukprot:GBG81733.1 hypothetical protein CBR_g33912 [Chara braunii]